jgi:AcrR family transcriptional regulator
MSSPPVGQRGPVEHERRQQIIEAAIEHFQHYGYSKTTIADLAKSIGLSTAYIYKFFESKRAIGEACCSIYQGRIAASLMTIANEKRPASERLRRIFLDVTRSHADLFVRDRRMHDIVASAVEERWQSVLDQDANLIQLIRVLVQEGREAGEFERKTPMDETCRAILLAMEPIRHPVLLKQRMDTLEEDATVMANLVLRSLAP